MLLNADVHSIFSCHQVVEYDLINEECLGSPTSHLLPRLYVSSSVLVELLPSNTQQRIHIQITTYIAQ